jgi:hypothetical protein
MIWFIEKVTFKGRPLLNRAVRNSSPLREMEMWAIALSYGLYCLYGQLMKTFRTVMKTFEMIVKRFGMIVE